MSFLICFHNKNILASIKQLKTSSYVTSHGQPRLHRRSDGRSGAARVGQAEKLTAFAQDRKSGIFGNSAISFSSSGIAFIYIL